MPSSNLGNLLQHLPRAQRARRIVRVDQHDAARARRELAFNVGKFRLPCILFIQVISIDRNSQLAQHSGIKRIVRLRRKNILARIHQRGNAKVNRFAHARSDEDIAHRSDALARRLAANRLECFRNSRRRRIAILALTHGLVSRFNDVRWSLEIEVERVAYIQRQNFVPLSRDFIRHASQITNGIADIVETLGSADLAALGKRHKRILPAETQICSEIRFRSLPFTRSSQSPRTSRSGSGHWDFPSRSPGRSRLPPNTCRCCHW